MGPHRRHARRRELTVVAQVVPDIPTFAVDDGFAYLVPEDLSGISVGSIVRVPLGGRTVRGYVTAVGDRAPTRRLRPIAARSGAHPVFDERLLRTARWAALHYVAPLSVLLGAAAPPNLPRLAGPPPAEAGAVQAAPPARSRPRYQVASGGHVAGVAAAVGPVVHSGRTAMVVVATAAECDAMAAALGSELGGSVLAATSSRGGAELTRVWSLLQETGGLVVVGTREIALWPCRHLGLVVVVEEGRPAMKAKQTPTLHVRDVMRRRSTIERFELLFRGPVPTIEVVAAGVDVTLGAGRVWPFVEIVDRGDEPPGGGVVGDGARAAVTAVAGRGGRVFVLVPRRGYAGAFVCAACGSIRRCPACGSAGGRSETCARCGAALPGGCVCGGTRFRPLGAGVGRVVDELHRSVGGAVGEAGSGARVEVGTERDLVGVADRDLAVAIDLDGAVLAPHFRGGEEALRLGARLAATVAGGRARRCLVQTSIPDHPVMTALRSGRPLDYLAAELEARRVAGLPPVGELIAVEVRGEAAETADGVIRGAAAAAVVRGPALGDGEARWLIQGHDLGDTRLRLRSAVQQLRDGGATVRIDADPVDL